MSDVTAQELAEAASQPGTFNFMDRLRGRNYPTDDVIIYLDEDLGYQLRKLEEKSVTANAKEADVIVEQIKAIREKLAKDAYVFTLRAVSSEAYDKLIEEVDETYPLEYEESVSPLTGRKSKEPLPNEDRATLFQALLWDAFIEKIVAPDGSDMVKPTIDEIPSMRLNLPLDGVRQVERTIDKLRMTVEWMDGIHDEGFFPTP